MDDLKRAWLAHFGAPLYGESLVRGRRAPDLERLVVGSLALARRDPTVARALPVLLWRQRAQLDLPKLRKLAQQRGRARALGFFLDLSGQLSGSRTLKRASKAPKRAPATRNFFAGTHTRLAKYVAEQNTPAVARAWGYRMNMGLDAFAGTFTKASRREALLAG